MNVNILDTIDMRELGLELRYAREKRGMTQQDAAEIIEVARTTIVAIEKGERRIKSHELVRLARAYGRDEGDFVRPTHPKTAPFQPQFRAAYRGRDQAIEDAAVDLLEQLARNYYELETLTGNRLKYTYPEEYGFAGMDVDIAAQSIAQQERQRLGLGDGPIPNLRDILEAEVGLRIFYFALKPSHYAAMYVYDPQLGGCIAVNKVHPLERRRWSLAHEYAHFLAHRYEADVFGVEYQRLPERERFADAFASHFLIPASGLMRHVRDAGEQISPADLCIWANYYGVSVEAMTLRLENVKRLPRGTWDRLKRSGFRVRQAQQQLNLEPVREQAELLPLRYQYLVVEAYQHNVISEGMFTHFLMVSRDEARDIIEQLRLYEQHSENGAVDLMTLLDSSGH